MYIIKRCGAILFFIIVTQTTGLLAQEDNPFFLDYAEWPVPDGAHLTLMVDRDTFFIGENILVHYCLKNIGDKPFKISMGGDGRFAPRHLRFKVDATDTDGKPVPDPYPKATCWGGLGTSPEIEPGETFFSSVPINCYCCFDRPGIYKIRIRHDLGWKETKERKIPSAEVTIKLLMPTQVQASKLIDEMCQMETEWCSNEKSGPYADFYTIRLPVYLPALTEQAEKGNKNALAGIYSIATPEATKVMIDLLNHKDEEFVLEVLRLLDERFPDPELSEKYLEETDPTHLSLIRNGWHSEFSGDLRAFAYRSLGAVNPTMVWWGAEILRRVGEKDDLAILIKPLDRVPPADRELVRAVEALIDKGANIPENPRSCGEIIVFLTALGRKNEFRPQGWVDRCTELLHHNIPYIRGFALQNLPHPPPNSLINHISSLMEDTDVNVRIAACNTAEDFPHPIPDVIIKRIPKLFADMDERMQVAACNLAGNTENNEFCKPVLDILKVAKKDDLIRASYNAGCQLGMKVECMEVLVSRLNEEDILSECMMILSNILTDIERVSTCKGINAEEVKALQARWTVFLKRYGDEIKKGREFKIGDHELTSDLFPILSFDPPWPEESVKTKK